MRHHGRLCKKILIDGSVAGDILIWDGDSWEVGDITDLTEVLPAGTAAGQMLFWTGTEWTYTETSELYWDDSNKRLGIGTATQVSLLEVDGAEGLAIETVTGNTTLDTTHSTVLVNASGNVTITLPTAASAYNSTDGIGRIYEIKKIDADADTVTIDGNGSETIDGGTTAVLNVQYESITIQSDGNNWHII